MSIDIGKDKQQISSQTDDNMNDVIIIAVVVVNSSRSSICVLRGCVPLKRRVRPALQIKAWVRPV